MNYSYIFNLLLQNVPRRGYTKEQTITLVSTLISYFQDANGDSSFITELKRLKDIAAQRKFNKEDTRRFIYTLQRLYTSIGITGLTKLQVAYEKGAVSLDAAVSSAITEVVILKLDAETPPSDVIYTGPQGYQVFWVTDSDSNGNGSGVADETIAGGILYLYNSSNNTATEITNQNIANNTTSGTPYKKFAVDYVANNPGIKVLLVQTARPGSNLVSDGVDNLHWQDGGDLRGPSEAAVDAALTFAGTNTPMGVFCNAFINDIIAATNIDTVEAGFDNCVDRILTKFPATNILYGLPGMDGNVANTATLRRVRNKILTKARDVANFNISWTAAPFEDVSWMQGDKLHYVLAAYQHIGACHARWFANSGYTNKFARLAICAHVGTLTTARKNQIALEYDILGNGFWGLEWLYHSKEPDDKDYALDYSFLSGPLRANLVNTIDGYTTSSGLNTSYQRTRAIPSTMYLRATQNDMAMGIYIKTLRSDASTLRAVMGAIGGVHFTLGHTTTGVYYRCNDSTLTLAPDATLANETRYIFGRWLASGTDAKRVYKNRVKLHGANVASGGFVNQNPLVGGANNSGAGTSTGPVDMDWYSVVCFTPSLVSAETIDDVLNSRVTNW